MLREARDQFGLLTKESEKFVGGNYIVEKCFVLRNELDALERSKQDILDYLLVKLYAENPSLPFQFLKSRALQNIMLFCIKLTTNELIELSFNPKRTVDFINIYGRKHLMTKARTDLQINSKFGPLNLKIDGWQNIMKKKLVTAIACPTRGFQVPLVLVPDENEPDDG